LRKQKGYTRLEDFAFNHNIPRVKDWRIENGKTNLTLRSLIKLLAIHKMTVEEFFYPIIRLSTQQDKNRLMSLFGLILLPFDMR